MAQKTCKSTSRGRRKAAGSAPLTPDPASAAQAAATPSGTLRVRTSRFGELEIPSNMALEFPQGLVGMPQARRFVLIDQGGRGPLRWLQSLEDPGLAFVVAEPANFFADYSIPTNVEGLDPLADLPAEDLLVLLILTISREQRSVTANLQGPLVIHEGRRLGRQLVLQAPGYSTRHPIARGAQVATSLAARPALAEEPCSS